MKVVVTGAGGFKGYGAILDVLPTPQAAMRCALETLSDTNGRYLII
jgi:hypothetical protein